MIHDPFADGLLRIRTIQDEIDLGTKDLIECTMPPSENDYYFIGKFIQIYCIADLEARRVTDALRSIVMGNDKAHIAQRLNDKDVYLHLRNVVEEWSWGPNLRGGLSRAADTLEMHRIHRHHFAHWVVRRFKDHDAFLFLTMNSNEAKQRDGVGIEPNEAKYAIVDVEALKSEADKLRAHSEYLTEVLKYLDTHQLSLRRTVHRIAGQMPPAVTSPRR